MMFSEFTFIIYAGIVGSVGMTLLLHNFAHIILPDLFIEWMIQRDNPEIAADNARMKILVNHARIVIYNMPPRSYWNEFYLGAGIGITIALIAEATI